MSNNIRKEPQNKPNFMYRKSSNSLIREYIHSFLVENMEHIGMGHSDLNMQVIDGLTSDIISDLYNLLSENKIEDLLETTKKKGGFIFNKTNKYNLNILLSNFKIKVYIGLAARIARENFQISSYNDLPDLIRIRNNEVDRGIYRIEVYRTIKGFTLADYLQKNNTHSGFFKNQEERDTAILYYKSDINELLDDFTKYVVDNYYWQWVDIAKRHTNNDEYDFDETDSIFYPNDNNPGNFVVAYGDDIGWYREGKNYTRITSIDTDNWTCTSVHLMIHNISIQFLGRIYSKESYPDDRVIPELIKFRDNINMFDAIQNFKKSFYQMIKKEHWFKEEDMCDYSFWGTGVQCTMSLCEVYIQELERCGIAPHKYDCEFVEEHFGVTLNG